MKKASEFLSSLPEKAQKKITYNLLKVEGGEINKELFKKLDDTEIWEFRTLFNGVSYRLVAFWDTTSDTLIVATHGIIKKTNKTPQKEIKTAEALRIEYFDNKNR
ncbi:MAG: type II toxin-antitoxin system RelE/ParE family toxin [Bacteroidales bacterium]